MSTLLHRVVSARYRLYQLVINRSITNCVLWLLNSAANSCQVLEARSPVTLRKAIKNETELVGMREAHLRDAVAIVEFLTWLDDKARTT